MEEEYSMQGEREDVRVSPRRAYKYCLLILNPEELHLHDVQNHGLAERIAHARAKRVNMAPDKLYIKHLLNKHSEVLDQGHYVRTERNDWMPIEWHLLGERLGRDPTEVDKANYILGRRSPSEEYRYYYFFRYPGNVKLTSHPHIPDPQNHQRT